jgi:hypothetical protein
MKLALFEKTIEEDDFDIFAKTVNGELMLEISMADVFTITLDSFDTTRVAEVLASAIRIAESRKKDGCGI